MTSTPRTAAPIRLAIALALTVTLLLGSGNAAAEPDGRDLRDGFTVIEGRDGHLFLDLEFSNFCAWKGGRFEAALRRLDKLADVIGRSGRRVVFTIAPGKGVIERDNVRWDAVPRAACARSGLREQVSVLDRFDSSAYVPLRRSIEGDDRQTYWRTDGHWTTVGATHWTRALARELDPELLRWQRYSFGSMTLVGYLNTLLGVDVPETVATATYEGPVRVRTAPGSAHDLGPDDHFPVDHSWVARPRDKTWTGRTLLVGDSFTLMALDQLRPLFSRGRYLWTGNVGLPTIAAAVAESDTVVLEVVQFFAAGNPLASKALRTLVRDALDPR
jgi:alginate O-acetyltransferase complex protein AlgJ